MSEIMTGTSGTFTVANSNYPINFFNIKNDDENYFCGQIELHISGEEIPDVNPEESEMGKLKLPQGEWYFPWLWFKETPDEKLIADTHGAIFIPTSLSEEEQERYDAINLIVGSEIYMAMTEEAWKQLLMVFHDWLKMKNIPQHKEYKLMADEVEVTEDPILKYMENEDEEDEGESSSFSGSLDEEENDE